MTTNSSQGCSSSYDDDNNCTNTVGWIWSVFRIVRWHELILPIDIGSVWRQRIISDESISGKQVKQLTTQNFSTNMIVMTLLLCTEINLLMWDTSSTTTNEIRASLHDEATESLYFWSGIFLLASIVLSFVSILSLFITWQMIDCIHDNHAKELLGSSIGQYVFALPGRLVLSSFYTFLIFIGMLLFTLFPVDGIWLATTVAISAILLIHVISSISAFGRIVLYKNGMMNSTIVSIKPDELERTKSDELINVLLRSGLSNRKSHKWNLHDNVDEESKENGCFDKSNDRDQCSIVDTNRPSESLSIGIGSSSFSPSSSPLRLLPKYGALNGTVDRNEVSKKDCVSGKHAQPVSYSSQQYIASARHQSQNHDRQQPMDDDEGSLDQDSEHQRRDSHDGLAIVEPTTQRRTDSTRIPASDLDVDDEINENGVWYNGIYFGEDDDDDFDKGSNPVVSERSLLLRSSTSKRRESTKNYFSSQADQIERGRHYLSIIRETPSNTIDDDGYQ